MSHTIDFKTQDWFSKETSQKVMSVLAQYGDEPRFIGGCVRNALYGQKVDDIDISTPLLPDDVLKMCTQAGFRVVPTGLDHGTVTVVVDQDVFEITTLREDIVTDGRHAKVSFSKDWKVDASRRDFTFNAMSVDRFGMFYDPYQGVKDLQAGYVRFIGDADQRLKEDYLRLLRFFRFHAFYGKGKPDDSALIACKNAVGGLVHLSQERITQELFKLLKAPKAARTLSLMCKQGILSFLIADIHQSDCDVLEMLCAFEEEADPLLRLACLLKTKEAAQIFNKKYKLSNKEGKRLIAALDGIDSFTPLSGENYMLETLYFKGVQTVRDQLYLYWAFRGFSGLGPRERALLSLVDQWHAQPAVFPLKGRDLIELNIKAGPEMGLLLKTIEKQWAEQGCVGTKEECLKVVSKLRAPSSSGQINEMEIGGKTAAVD